MKCLLEVPKENSRKYLDWKTTDGQAHPVANNLLPVKTDLYQQGLSECYSDFYLKKGRMGEKRKAF